MTRDPGKTAGSLRGFHRSLEELQVPASDVSGGNASFSVAGTHGQLGRWLCPFCANFLFCFHLSLPLQRAWWASACWDRRQLLPGCKTLVPLSGGRCMPWEGVVEGHSCTSMQKAEVRTEGAVPTPRSWGLRTREPGGGPALAQSPCAERPSSSQMFSRCEAERT